MKRAISFILVGISFFASSKGVCSTNSPNIISAVLEGPLLKDRIQKTSMTFTRDSVAYTFDGRQVPNGEPRFQKMAIFNRPEYTLAGPYNNENVVALAYCDGYFWGAKPWTANSAGNSLYRSLDANNWEPVATLAKGVIKSLYVTQAGLLLVGVQGPGSVCVWDPDTESLLRTLTMLSKDPYPKHWSWAEMDGTVYVGEYGSKELPDNSRRIYRSLDGGWNWEMLYDPPPQYNYHVHKVLADPYRPHIYWSHGDWYYGAGSQLFRSADGGQSWQLLSNVEQPTAGIARPEGTYFGSDSGAIGIYRFINGSEKGEFVCTNLVEGYIWDMRDFNDVIYATSNYHQYDVNATVHATVVISRDGKHWGNLYQWEPRISGLERFASKVDDTIYAIMEEEVGDVTTMSFASPIIRTSWGIHVEPAIENLLANPCDSSFEGCGQTSWNVYGRDSVISVSSDISHSGINSLKVSYIGYSGIMGAVSPIIDGNFPAGTNVIATVGVSGWNNIRWLFARIRDMTNQRASPSVHCRSGTGWIEMTIYWQLPKDSKALRVDAYTSSASPGDVLYIDSAALTVDLSPISFHIGGQKRAAETLSHHVAFPSCWTDVFCWQPPYSPSAVDQTKVIKSWSVEDGSSWLQLVMDDANSFKLEEVKGDLTKTLASVPAPDFLPESLIRFAVVQDVNEISLHILCPQGWLLTSGSRTEVCPTIVFFGSTPDGTMQAGGLYSNARVYNANMTSEQIVQVINEIAEQGWLSGDLNGDGDVDFSDLFVLAENWLYTDCDYTDWCSHADMDMNKAVDFRDLAHFAEFWQNGCK